ncbi:MAG: signal recognition particle protein [Candidatus Palauibacterales bacterium]|nr:signal recognition particle protein [Candidatus Palauibacterales bacterium]
MFEQLSKRLDNALSQFTERGILTEEMLDEGLRDVRRALLEADVNYRVAKDFLGRVRERALGEDVMDSVDPGDQVVKIVHDELSSILGEGETGMETAAVPPTVIMLVGLQGSGKTTTAVKLARRLSREGRSPVLAACDPYRPAAADQLAELGEDVDVPVLRVDRPDGAEPADGGGRAAGPDGERKSEEVAAFADRARQQAKREGASHLILDMAGRVQADEEMMGELEAVKERVDPEEVLLVADAMTGQEAVKIAEGFHDSVGLTGVVLTKMEGDARGGAALSIYGVLGIPVKFVGIGERPEDLQVFSAERMAGRILQMGDIVGLVERAQQTIDEDATKRMEEKIRGDGEFDLEDFLTSLRQLQNMGPLDNILKMLPGVKPEMLEAVDTDPERIKHMEAIVLSMTPEERRKPRVLNGSRRARIAEGAGRPVHEVNQLVKRFGEMKKMMKKMQGGGGPGGGMGSLMGGGGGGKLSQMKQMLS